MSRLETCKVVLIGDGSVGKTCLVERITRDGFGKVYKQTIGADFHEKTAELGGRVPYNVQLWDIGGQSISSKMLPTYLNDAVAVLLCYDVTSASSLDDVEDWLHRAREHAPDASHFLLGNKADLARDRDAAQARLDAFVESHRLAGGYLVSARSGDSVLRAFYSAAGIATGHPLSEHELAFHDRAIVAVIERDTDADKASAAHAEDLERIRREDEEAARRRDQAIARAVDQQDKPCCVLF